MYSFKFWRPQVVCGYAMCTDKDILEKFRQELKIGEDTETLSNGTLFVGDAEDFEGPKVGFNLYPVLKGDPIGAIVSLRPGEIYLAHFSEISEELYRQMVAQIISDFRVPEKHVNMSHFNRPIWVSPVIGDALINSLDGSCGRHIFHFGEEPVEAV